MFNKKIIMITGGTGSFGTSCIEYLLKNYNLKKIIIFSRDENKQHILQKKYPNSNLRFIIGDVRDKDRLSMSMKDVNFVIHAAALKHVPIAEYNPIECIQTNVIGAQNIIHAAIERKVEKVIALSTDKATNPINLYGASKLAAEKLFIAAHSLTGKQKTFFGIVRYGNVLSSRGSVIPYFKEQIKKNNTVTVTDKKMTRFFISLPKSVEFVLNSFNYLNQGEVFVPKLHSLKITDLAKSLNDKVKLKFIGKRPGEKLDELLISKEENDNTYETKKFYVILSSTNILGRKQFLNKMKKKKFSFKKVDENFFYSSYNNKDFINSADKIRTIFKKL